MRREQASASARSLARRVPQAAAELSTCHARTGMSELSTAVCSIAATQRRRFFWAAWWTGAPRHAPFRKPDAAHGGARTREEALEAAERCAGRHLVLIEPYWAYAWKRVLRGETPPPPPSQAESPRRRPERADLPVSAWAELGVSPGATLLEVKRAFRTRALETHPDRGGDPRQFQAVQRAYERLVARLTRTAARPARRSPR